MLEPAYSKQNSAACADSLHCSYSSYSIKGMNFDLCLFGNSVSVFPFLHFISTV